MGDASQHSRLFAPSSLKRNLHCIAAAILNAVAPREPDSPESIEGTLAHSVCERSIRAYWLQQQGRISAGFDVSCASLIGDSFKGQVVDKIMAAHCQGYVDYVVAHINQPGARVFIEQKVDYSLAIGVPIGSAYGRGDCFAYVPSVKTLYIDDYKYGKWLVEAEHNVQCLAYALAAIIKFSFLFDIERVVVTIYQPRVPRSNPAVSWEITRDEVLAFGNWVRGKAPSILLAEEYYLAGGVKNIPANFFKQSDDGCRFCRAETCPARAASIFKVGR